MKPISTLLRGLPSVNLTNKQSENSDYERSDVCAVSAASVVMQHAVAFEIAAAVLDRFGGDSMEDLIARIC
jgi:chorismate synthase